MSTRIDGIPIISAFCFPQNDKTYKPCIDNGDLLIPMVLGDVIDENVVYYRISGDLIRQIVKEVTK